MVLAASLCAAGRASLAAEPTPPSDTVPGAWRLGPLQLVPRLHIGTVGVDTNVFYTAIDRRTDFTAAGGPGLDAVLPLGGGFRVTGGGDLGYVYFLRTTSQRRMTGDGRARLEWSGVHLLVAADGFYGKTFARPSLEVDRRVGETAQRAGGEARVRLGPRLRLGLAASGARREVDADASFLGSDLRRGLSEDLYREAVDLAYALTPKTSLIVLADGQQDRFLFEDDRDVDSNRLGGGFELASTTRLSGRAVAGVRRFRFARASAGARPESATFAAVDMAYRLGPRTVLGASYRRDRENALLRPESGLPLLDEEAVGVRVEKRLFGPLDLRLRASLTRLRGQGPVRIEGSSGPTVGVRADRVREASGDLGYTFFSHLRLGLAASWLERRSPFADLGIRGLILGGTLGYEP